ncbi:MAG TPA: DUF1249 domain-containing protein [Gammaproteobacteria bacterium]|jgi:uncharacterized protein YqiB (DUF1249 family)|nr:DUF1249 domain-containing protein [Gammaproteobacteria bacterium]
MLVDSLIIPECVYRPGTFTGLMTLYESNYIKLHNLTTGFDWPDDVVVSSTPEDSDLHAKILRRETYTSTLKLTYLFPEADGAIVADPDLILRVYHDARLVEVVSGQERHCHHKLREITGGSGKELGRRWRVNMMLNKWLDYLFDVGHRLDGGVRPPR